MTAVHQGRPRPAEGALGITIVEAILGTPEVTSLWDLPAEVLIERRMIARVPTAPREMRSLAELQTTSIIIGLSRMTIMAA